MKLSCISSLWYNLGVSEKLVISWWSYLAPRKSQRRGVCGGVYLFLCICQTLSAQSFQKPELDRSGRQDEFQDVEVGRESWFRDGLDLHNPSSSPAGVINCISQKTSLILVPIFEPGPQCTKAHSFLYSVKWRRWTRH